MIKRFTLATLARLPMMKEMPDGDYVRYEDYEAEQKVALKVLESILEEVEKLEKLHND